jgi:hypothetical protein
VLLARGAIHESGDERADEDAERGKYCPLISLCCCYNVKRKLCLVRRCTNAQTRTQRFTNFPKLIYRQFHPCDHIRTAASTTMNARKKWRHKTRL